jgi:membrane protein DedA with SNARE-associated domain
VYAALTIFAATLSTLVLPVPEELALLAAGFWAQQGALPLWAAWLAASSANIVGDTVSYLVGRQVLQRLLQSRLGRRLVAPELREWAEDLVRRHRVRAILLGRFLVALRGPVYFAIGAAKVPMLQFELINSSVALIEGGALVYLGYLFGHSVKTAHQVRWAEIAVGAAVVLVLIAPPLWKRRLMRRRTA